MRMEGKGEVGAAMDSINAQAAAVALSLRGPGKR